jgi:hypothetical protein
MPTRRSPVPIIACSLPLSIAVSSAIAAQTTAASQHDLGVAAASPDIATTTVEAARAARAPIIDGRDGDDVWLTAREVSAFRIYDPIEDGDPTLRTMAKVAYDERNLYVLVRAFDPRPDSIVSLLSRRDVRTPSDQIKVVVDSYFDRRTAYEFAVNPAGVKRDYYVYNDTNEDESWDGVWDVGTAIDSLGWIAEFRIPLSQLRFPERPEHTFGIGFYRDVARSNERVSWPVLRRSRFGFASQLGELSGIRGLGSPRRLEVLPYSVQQNVSVPRGNQWGREQRMAVGADLKYGVTSNITLDATVNPDFGQVEADPAIFNLSALEQFVSERRPFFLEGTGIFKFDLSCSDDICQGLFYSRRIGRLPQLGGNAADGGDPDPTTILGAAKLTGRLPNGISLGVLQAVTQREVVDAAVVEPMTSYTVARVQRDFGDGGSGVGLMVTGVHRDLEGNADGALRRSAYTGGIDFRRRFGDNRYSLAGYLIGSLVRGDTGAIAATQRSGARSFERPDDDLVYDPTRTSLHGAGMQLGLSKIGGGITRFWTGYSRWSPGLELNDVGFLPQVNNEGYSNWLALVFNTPRAFYRRLQINFNEWQNFTIDGRRTSLGGNINANASLTNQWFVYTGLGTNAPAYCTSCMRGGPAVLQSWRLNSWLGIEGDARRVLIPSIHIEASRGDEGRSRAWSVSPGVQARAGSRLSLSLFPSYRVNVDDRQWVRNFGEIGADTTHYTVAHLHQRTFALTTRADFTLTPNLTFQFYGQPFITSGQFSNWRELADARASDYDRRYRPFTLRKHPGGFNAKQFRSNTVVRWEYRPGSALFLVWAQGREQDGIDAGTFELSRDAGNLFGAHPSNTFLVKASWWLSM